MIATKSAVQSEQQGMLRELAAMQGEAVAPARKRGHEPRRQVEVVGTRRRQRKAWKPSGRDELVYQWVRFEGKTQDWVARALEVSQTTVSRIVQRYEKWQAHAQPGQNGTLSRAERQRMQWWLTYERNERILASSLRMAHDMEFPQDQTKSVTRRPTVATSGEQEIRTEHSVLDRSGMAARFFRLAFRINMEQLKLVEREPEEPLPSLTAQELADFETESDAVEAEIVASRQRQEEAEAMRHRLDSEVADAVAAEVEARLGPKPEAGTRDQEPDAAIEGENERKAETLPLKMHKVHNCRVPECGASADWNGTCAINDATGKMQEIGLLSLCRDQSDRSGTDTERRLPNQ